MPQLATVGPEFSLCSVCQKPCQPWRERCWNDGDHLVHEACKNWDAAPFPFGWELERLRHLSRALRRTQRAVDAAGVWLATLARNWPQDATARLNDWATMRERLRQELLRLASDLGKR
jgi:hypothetical protein